MVTLIAALFPGILGLVLAIYFVKDYPETGVPRKVKPLDRVYFKSRLERFFSVRSFWLIVISHSCSRIWRHADMLLGIFFMDATHLGEDNVPMLVTLHPIGFIVGILIAGPMYNSLSSPRSKLKMINWMYATSVSSVVAICLVSILRHSIIKTIILGFSVLLASVGLAVQYFIVSGVFVIEFGGDAAGLCISLMDSFGQCVSACAFIPIGLIADSFAGWPGVWIMIATILVLGCATMNSFFQVFYLSPKKLHDSSKA